MKIILIYYEQRGYGGVDTHMAHLVNNWPGKDDNFVILSNRDNEGLDFLKTRIMRKKNFDIKTIDLGKINSDRQFLIKALKFGWNETLGFVSQFLRVVSTVKPDVLISDNGGYPGGLTCFLAVLIGRFYRPKMRTALLVHHAPTSSKGLTRKLADCLSFLIRRWKISLITVSKASKKALEARTPLKPFKVIYNGLESIKDEPTFLNLRKRHGIGQSRVLLGMIGPIDPHKGHSVLIEAFNQSRLLQNKAHLLIVGRGNDQLEESLKEMVRSANLSNLITFTGFLPEDSNTIIKQFDVLVMPTTEFEGFGYSMTEAMALGVPVVICGVGAIPEIIQDGKSGILVEPNNASQLKIALEHLVVDPGYRKRLGEQGKKHILAKFPAKKMAQEYYDFINSLTT